MSTLTIISHTEHYRSDSGEIVGLGSTVTEINNLLEVFDKIIHVAMLHTDQPPESSLPYCSERIKFVALPAVGGKGILDKLGILWQAPRIIGRVRKALNHSDYFQFRAPTGIGVFVLPYIIMFSQKKGWFKYAGNWKQSHAPLAYQIQRWLLEHQNRMVTINGQWPDQPKQCLTFENPCLTDQEVVQGEQVIRSKSLDHGQLSLCFVGRLEQEKGIGLLISALKQLSTTQKDRIKAVHVVGYGKSESDYKTLALTTDLNFQFHGYLSRTDVHRIYKDSHAIVLPSASEGFPKVIAEAMNYGCLPLVSDISSLSHYIEDGKSGFLFYPITIENILANIERLLELGDEQYSEMIQNARDSIFKFTYTHYNARIKNEILDRV